MLTNNGLINNAISVGNRIGFLSPDQKTCLAAPLFHCMGNVLGSMMHAVYGMELVFPSPVYSPTACLQQITAQNCTHLIGTPTMWVDIIHKAKRESIKLESLKGGLMSGAACPPELLKQAKNDFGMSVSVVYGHTESSPVVCGMFTDDSDDKILNTVGFPLNHQEVKIVDSENKTVPIGTPGQIVCRGYNTMKGYYNDPEKTAKSIQDGWYFSGDRGYMTESGHVAVIGREDDMFIRGGENIQPKEIENFVQKYEYVLDAQVVGVPDKRLGSEVAIFVKVSEENYHLKNSLVKDYKTKCADDMAVYKIPKYWKIVTKYPTTQSGKVQKFKLIQMAREVFDLDE